MVRHGIANPYYAGSNPVTHSNNIHTYITAGYVSGQTIRLITWETAVRICHPQPILFRETRARCMGVTVNHWLEEFDPLTRSHTIKKYMKSIILSILMFTCLSANAVTVYAYNITKQYPIVDSEIDTIKPIASITKLMTALVLIESGVSLNEKVSYKGMFYSHKKFTREELLNLMLVKMSITTQVINILLLGLLLCTPKLLVSTNGLTPPQAQQETPLPLLRQ